MRTRLIHFNPMLSRHVVTLAYRFVQRWDLYAQQLGDGHYICIHEPLTIDHIFSHLEGAITLGTYVLDMESKARIVVLDADDKHGFDRLGRLARTLADKDIPSYLEKSRRGGHLWLFLSNAISGHQAREFGLGILTTHQINDVEIFPKQDELADGPGSLLRMPFGIHRLTGKRYGFYTPDGLPLAPTIQAQIEKLTDPHLVSDSRLLDYRSNAPQRPQKIIAERFYDNADTATQIKNKIKVHDFVSQYVDLKPSSSGAIGLCPFHDDHHPSFSVNDRENYWHCFAGCGGGSVIDFWMKWRDCAFSVAVNELAQMLK